jgi:hypothetical protein
MGRAFGLRRMGMPGNEDLARLLAPFPFASTSRFSSCLDLFARQSYLFAAVCPLAPAQVPHERGEIVAMFLENLFANFPNLIYDRVLHCSFPLQLFRRANNRALIPGVTTCPLQLCQDLGIVELVCSNNEVAARPGCLVADNGGFQVDSGFQGLLLEERSSV